MLYSVSHSRPDKMLTSQDTWKHTCHECTTLLLSYKFKITMRASIIIMYKQDLWIYNDNYVHVSHVNLWQILTLDKGLVPFFASSCMLLHVSRLHELPMKPWVYQPTEQWSSSWMILSTNERAFDLITNPPEGRLNYQPTGGSIFFTSFKHIYVHTYKH